MSAPRIAWVAAGAPRMEACADIARAVCWLCGGVTDRAVDLDAWLPDGFTSQPLVAAPSSPWVCEPCVFVCSRVSPVPGRPPKEGKALGGNWRNYTHMAEGGRYANASKGEKPAIREFLCRPKDAPWFCGVADSGQKHVLPFAPVNAPGIAGAVQFDEERVRVPVAAADDIARLSAALTEGATKEEIETGDYRPQTWRRVGLDRLRAHEDMFRQLRGGAWFRLALWLAQRDEEAVQARLAAEKEARNAGKRGRGRQPDGGAAADAHGHVSEQRAAGSPAHNRLEPPRSLGAAEQPRTIGGDAVGVGGAVVQRDAARAPGPGAEQLDLFGHA